MLDAGGDITLDADGADIALKDGGTLFATITNDSSNNTLDITAEEGTIDFGDENLTTTGNITGSTRSQTRKLTRRLWKSATWRAQANLLLTLMAR